MRQRSLRFCTLALRRAIRAFATRYNAEWLIEKNGHRSPLDRRDAWLDQTFRRAA